MSIRQIKKYANRRLYDTGASRYVSLEDVKALFAESEQVCVIDATNGADITRAVLFQILAEDELHGKTPVLPQRMLAELVGYEDSLLAGILGNYLEQCLTLFIRHQDVFRGQMLDFDGESPVETLRQMMDRQEALLAGKSVSVAQPA
ncbi:MAG: polyhydroxyalkanoate synthesis regulator DNA-binding domain-containing protein [Cardiobacteriaceae bacterium]|nr:polyhydroxyalkanoate synthesis regulator DNA-binding domain-containing protein [Cardiobacteriaceae bacterium]